MINRTDYCTFIYFELASQNQARRRRVESVTNLWIWRPLGETSKVEPPEAIDWH